MKRDCQAMVEGYLTLAAIFDVDFWDMEVGSQAAKDALVEHAKKVNAKYDATTGAPSEYAVGYRGKPAFDGEKTALAKFLALAARSWEYTAENPFKWGGYGIWVEGRGLRWKVTQEVPT